MPQELLPDGPLPWFGLKRALKAQKKRTEVRLDHRRGIPRFEGHALDVAGLVGTAGNVAVAETVAARADPQLRRR
jgi:hypothetical protein